MPHDHQYDSTRSLVQALRKAPPPESPRNAAARRMLADAAQGAERVETFRSLLGVTPDDEAEIDAITRIGAEVDPSLLDAREAPAPAPEMTPAERKAAEQAQADARHQADRQVLVDAGYEPVWSVPDKRWTPDYSQLSEHAADRFDEAWIAGQGIEAAVSAAQAADEGA